MKTMQTRKM